MTDEKKDIAEQEQDVATQSDKEATQPSTIYDRNITAFDASLIPRGSYPTGSTIDATLIPKGSYPTGPTAPKVHIETPASSDVEGISPTLAGQGGEQAYTQATAQVNTQINAQPDVQANAQPNTPINAQADAQEVHADAQDNWQEKAPEPISFAGRDSTAPLNVQAAPSRPMSSPSRQSINVPPTATPPPTSDQQASPAQENVSDTQESSEQKGAQEVIERSFAGKMFDHMAKFAPIYLLFIFIFHTATSVLFPSTYFPSELQHLELFETVKQTKQWLLPPVTDTFGIAYPGYYWLMTLVDLIPMPETLFLPVLSAITAFIAIFSVYIMGACLKLNRNGAFASVLVLLSCPLFVIFLHMAQPEVLTMSFFCLALGLLYRGWTRESAPFAFIFGFVFLALSVLTGGFLPLWVSLIVSIVLIFWRLDIHRAHKLDAVVGFGFLVLCFAVWLVLVILISQHANVLDSIMKDSINPFMPPYWPLPMPWWTLVILACGLIPWIFVPLFSPWFTILKNTLSNLKASRTTNSGPTWLYLSAIVGLVILVLQKNDAPLAALPLLPIFGLILGKTICNFGPRGSNLFFLVFAIFLLVAGIAATVVSIPATAEYWTPYVSAQLAEALKNVYGMPIFSALFIIASLVLIRFTKRTQPHGALLVVALFSVLVVQPVVLFVAPSLVGHYTKYHQKGNGLIPVPDFFGMPKVSLPTAAVKEVEPVKQEAPAINSTPVTIPETHDTAGSQAVPVAPVVPVEQNPANPANPASTQPAPAEQNTGTIVDENPPVAVPMTE